MAKIPEEWLSKVRMNRVICHWTAGGHKASHLDKAHYHLLVEAGGNLVRGKYAISANSPIRKERGYAAHTRQANTRSIGITCCSMFNARERPFDPGPFPMTEKQWTVMAEVTAELCKFYQIPVLPHTVLGHGEVERNLGIKQRGKWDPLALPWKPKLSLHEAGDLFREQVKGFLAAPHPEETEPIFELEAVVIRGHEFSEAIMENGSAFVAAAPVAKAFDLNVKHDPQAHDLDVKLEGKKYDVPYTVIDLQLYADTADLARIFGLERTWDERKHIVTLA